MVYKKVFFSNNNCDLYFFFAFFAHRMNVTLVNYTVKGGAGINRNKGR